MDIAELKDHFRDHPLVRKTDEWWAHTWTEYRSQIIQYGGGGLVVLLLVGGYSYYQKKVNHEALVEVEKLEMLYARGSFDSAMTDAKNFTAKYGGSKWGGLGYFYLANCQFHAAQYDDAKSSFETASKKWLPDPVKGSALMAVPQILEAKGEYQTAAESYRALLKKPACEFLKAELLMSAARCHEQLGQLQQAVEAYQEVVQQFGGTPWHQKAKDRSADLEAKLMAPPPPVTPNSAPAK